MKGVQFRLEEEGGVLRYLLALPSAPKSQKALWPVLCFLHGYDEGAPMKIEDALTRHGPLRRGNPVRAINNFIVIAPQLPVRGDIWHRNADAVQQIVHDVQKRHGGDPRRTYLTGFSFGGNGVFDLALEQHGFWAALWAVDPTRIPSRDPKLPVWLSFGEAARYNKKGFIRALDLAPIDAGTDHIYLDEGADHVGSAMLAYRDERIYSWLLSKRLT
jgi:predicted peptidase